MTQNFKKLAIAAGVSVGMAALSMPSHAVIQGAPGEALLIPLVVYHDAAFAGDYTANTIVQVTIPSTVGFDTVPNDFTAPNTTPTATPPTLLSSYDSLDPTNTIHWFWFDQESIHQLDQKIKVTADDVVQINWREEAASSVIWNGVAGYMVVSTDAGTSSQAADFSMYGDAWLELDVDGAGTVPASLATIPVLPMSDGEDGPIDTPVSNSDNVKYIGGIPSEVSPTVSGIRTNASTGALDDLTVFDLPLNTHTAPTMHVVWIDKNLSDDDYLGDAANAIPVNVFDSEENDCSATTALPYELNVIWVPRATGDTSVSLPFFSTSKARLCAPSSGYATEAGFVQYQIREYIDTGIDAPESAAVAFSLLWSSDLDTTPGSFEITTVLAHERGTFKLR